MPSNTIWISYDLGVRGDYEGLYAWLDLHKAKECGSNLAVLSYDYSGDLIKVLKADLDKSVEMDKRARIYVIHRDEQTKKMKGRFVFGNRRASPWAGASGQDQEEDEES